MLSAIFGRRESCVALEVSAEEEHIVIANLIGDLPALEQRPQELCDAATQCHVRSCRRIHEQSVYPMKHLLGFLLWQPFEYRPTRQTVLHFADAQIALQVGQGDYEEDAKEQQQDEE
jgi:hypothetical protein